MSTIFASPVKLRRAIILANRNLIMSDGAYVTKFGAVKANADGTFDTFRTTWKRTITMPRADAVAAFGRTAVDLATLALPVVTPQEAVTVPVSAPEPVAKVKVARKPKAAQNVTTPPAKLLVLAEGRLTRATNLGNKAWAKRERATIKKLSALVG